MNEEIKVLEEKSRVIDPKFQEIIPSGLAKVFYESKIFKDVQSEAQAIVKILAGREMGLSPIQSMNGVYIVENKIGYETKILLSKLKKSGKYDYEVAFSENKEKVEKATVDFFRIRTNGQEGKEFIGSSQFTIQDAARIGLINKQAYKNYPQLMMFYRAASNGMKMYCPDILDGAALAEDYIEIDRMSNDAETEVRLNGQNIKKGDEYGEKNK
ncbi:MAG: hypothetical protein LBK92_02310 [Endomicrobium sp.]|jgi:hypothetical protein|nr:hypothetical protein [Endomicrobium sp.]